MTETKVLLNTIEKVKDFVNITYNLKPELDIIAGRYVIDAKSILSIFSVNLAEPLTLKIHSDDKKECEEILEKIQRFIVTKGRRFEN